MRFNYVAVPIKLAFTTNGKFFGFGAVGFIPAIQTKSTLSAPTFDGATIEYTGHSTANISKDVSKFDMAYLLEAGCGFTLSPNWQIVSSIKVPEKYY